MSQGMITKQELKQFENIMRDPKELNSWVERIKHDEPEFYSWTQKMSGRILGNLNKSLSGTLPMGLAQELAHGYIGAFSVGWILYMKFNDDRLNMMLNDDTNEDYEFDKWMHGEMPESYYEYSLRGLHKDNSKYIAKKNFQKKQKERKKRKSFRDVKKKALKKQKNNGSYLSKFNGSNENGKDPF